MHEFATNLKFCVLSDPLRHCAFCLTFIRNETKMSPPEVEQKVATFAVRLKEAVESELATVKANLGGVLSAGEFLHFLISFSTCVRHSNPHDPTSVTILCDCSCAVSCDVATNCRWLAARAEDLEVVRARKRHERQILRNGG